ncbi:hypothetical protein [Streptomyces sp. NBC_00470]|uniref:hypothetical protein n=1 Tax=Streptomyces sp. NBC_00470 TaxID=2975753 RepID=UPI002F90D4C0
MTDLPLMLKCTLPVDGYQPYLPALETEAATAADFRYYLAEGDVDDPAAPTRITLLADTAAAALARSRRHLTVHHARYAYTYPGALAAIREDQVYAKARDRAKTLSADQRDIERGFAVWDEDSRLAQIALWDVMREYGELPAP